MSSDPLRIDLPGLTEPASAGDSEAESRRRSPRARASLPTRVWGWSVGLVLLATLPFLTLIRSSVFFFHHYALPGWVALFIGGVTTVALLLVYLVLASVQLGGKGRVPRIARRGVAILVGAYCLYALVYLSGANAKTEEIRRTYTGLNPVLRVAVSTLLLADREGVLTATGREPEDYARWGLPANERSLHIPQEDGWVYAVDIRTLGRPEWRNRLVTLYFRALGFQTIRHTGTAHHLHVALSPNQSGSGLP